MYTTKVEIEGISPLLHHRFAPSANGKTKPKKTTGVIDYSDEWRATCYVNEDQELFQPATHIKAAMTKAAVNYKIAGKRGKTFKDLCRAAVFVDPFAIPHIDNNGEIRQLPKAPPVTTSLRSDEPVYIDVRPVVVNRGRVERARLALNTGWRLLLHLEVADDQLPIETLQEILIDAGLRVGIGDNRPENGRFRIVQFETVKGAS